MKSPVASIHLTIPRPPAIVSSQSTNRSRSPPAVDIAGVRRAGHEPTIAATHAPLGGSQAPPLNPPPRFFCRQPTASTPPPKVSPITLDCLLPITGSHHRLASSHQGVRLCGLGLTAGATGGCLGHGPATETGVRGRDLPRAQPGQLPGGDLWRREDQGGVSEVPRRGLREDRLAGINARVELTH